MQGRLPLLIPLIVLIDWALARFGLGLATLAGRRSFPRWFNAVRGIEGERAQPPAPHRPRDSLDAPPTMPLQMARSLIHPAIASKISPFIC